MLDQACFVPVDVPVKIQHIRILVAELRDIHQDGGAEGCQQDSHLMILVKIILEIDDLLHQVFIDHVRQMRISEIQDPVFFILLCHPLPLPFLQRSL